MPGDVTVDHISSHKHSGWPRYLLCLFVLAETAFLTTVPSKGLISSISWNLPLHGGIDNSLSYQGLKLHWLSSPHLADLMKPLLSLWPLLHASSHKEPQVRVECQGPQLGRKMGYAPPHLWYYPTLISHIPQQHSILWKARMENEQLISCSLKIVAIIILTILLEVDVLQSTLSASSITLILRNA